MKAYVRLLGLWVLLLTFVGTARATDVTVAATTIPNFNPSNAGAAVTIANVTVTNGSPTVSCSACLRPTWVGMSGFTITLGSTNYTVSYVTSTSSLTLTANYAGTTGTVTATWHPYVEWRFYADRAFQPLGASYIVQPGTPGTGSWYKRYAASILTVSGVKTLYLPEITIDATTDSPGPTNQARYMAAFYRPDNSLIQFYACFEQFVVPPTTPTSWTALCAYNSPPAIVPPANEAYTKTQIDARFPVCTTGQMIYYATTGNAQSCLTVGSGLTLSGGTLSTTGTAGTVTSVGLSAPTYFSVSGSPVTTTGTLALSWSSTAAFAYEVLAGATPELVGTGSAPTFRYLTTYDIPTGREAINVQTDRNYPCSGDGTTTTTGSITATFNLLSVASATGWRRGMGIRIAGAGVAGGDLYTTIDSISGSVFVLNDAASTTVAGAIVYHDDTACIAAHLATAQTSGNRTVYFPAGVYLTAPITASLGGLVIEGDGPTKSIIKARAIDQNVISLTSAGSAVNLVMRDIGIHGQGKAAGTTGHCIYINDAVAYFALFELDNLEIKNCRENGLYVPYIFNGVIRRVTTDEIGINHFDLGPANTVTLDGNYARTIESGGAGYRLRGGTYTLISNNGMDPDSGDYAFWGIFGSKNASTTGTATATSATLTAVATPTDFRPGDWITITGAGAAGADLTTYITAVNNGASTITIATAASTTAVGTAITSTDGIDSYFRGAMLGNNIEDFVYYGLRLKEASTLGTMSGNSFLSSADVVAHNALKFDYADATQPAGTWDSTNRFLLQGGTWLNGAAINAQGVPFLVIGRTNDAGDPFQYYDTSIAALVDLPQIGASWDSNLDEMFSRTLNIQGNNIKVGTGSTTTGQLVFQNAANGNRFTLQAGTTGSNLTFTLPIADGSASDCLITNGAGVLSFGACGGSSLPVADTQTIVKGSVDATKLIRFEVDGLTTATTRVLTPPDADIIIAGSAAALTSGRIPYATTGGLLTDSARLLWDNSTYKLSLSNASTLGLLLQAGGGTTAAHAGTGYGLIMPYVGGSQSSGPGIWWTDGTYASLFGMWLNLGLNIQGTGGVNNVKIRKATDTSSDGDIVFDLRPNDGRFDLYPYGTSAGNTTQIAFRELAANGTNYVGFKAADSIAADITWTLPSTDSTGSQCLASNGSGTLSWNACSGAGTPGGSNKQVQFNNSSAFGGAAGFEYQSGASPNVSITAQNAAYVPLYVNGASSQTANLQQWAVNSTVYNVITKDGYLYLGRGETSATPSAGRIYATGGSGTNIAGASLIFYGGAGTGTGAGGSIAFYTAAAGGSGSSPNTPVIQYEIDQKGNHFFGNAQLIQAATDGFVHIPGIANVPSGVPTLITGLVPLAVDETNYRLYGYSGGSWRNLTGGAGGITIGTTAITSGTAGRILYETSGNVVGEIAGSSADANGAVQFAASARTSGGAQYFRINTPADTGQTASTESVGAYFGGNGSGATVTRTWAAGALTTQRENVFVAPTYAFASASTITTAATVAIEGAPVTGTNATITSPFSLLLGAASNAVYSIGVINNSNQILMRFYADTVTKRFEFLNNADSTTASYVGKAHYGGAYLTDTGGQGSIGGLWGSTSYGFTSIRTFDDAVTANHSPIRLNVGSSAYNANLAMLYVLSSSASRVGLRVDSAANSTVALNQFYLDADDTATVAPHSVFAVDSNGSVAAGFGGQLQLQLESSTTAKQDAAAINWLWTDHTHATRTAALSFSTVQNAGSLTERARVTFDGTRSHFILGNGATAASPTAGLVQATSGSGTDIAGADLILAGGQPTGSGAAGQLVRKYSLVGATGTTLRSLSSNNYNIPSVMFTSTADAAVTNTTSETTIIGSGVGTTTVEAGMWRVGRTIRVRVTGYLTTTSTPTLQIRFKLGSTTIADTGAVTLNSSISGNEFFEATIDITCRSIGATGTVFGNGIMIYHLGSGTANMDALEAFNTAAVTVDTTAAQAVNITAQWGTANPNNSIVGTTTTIEILN